MSQKAKERAVLDALLKRLSAVAVTDQSTAVEIRPSAYEEYARALKLIMPEELFNDLWAASQWLSRPIDGGLVRMLVEEVARLREVVSNRESEVNQLTAGLEIEIARLTQAIRQRQEEDAKSQARLSHAIAEVAEAYQPVKRTVDKQNYRLNELKELLSLCNDGIGEPQVAKVVRRWHDLPERPTGEPGAAWIQINETQMRKFENIPHTVHNTIYGVYFDRSRDNMCYAFRLVDGRCFALKGLLTARV